VFKARYGASPRQLRGRGRPDPGSLRCRLEFRPPIAWPALLGYLSARAIRGVECVEESRYRRTAEVDGHRGWLSIGLAADGCALETEISRSLAPAIGATIARIKDLFDLAAVPALIDAHLRRDPRLAPLVRCTPGMRVPGAFDGFETAMRVIVGQCVSLRASSTVATRIATAFGEPIATPFAGLDRLTPTAARLAASDHGALAALGLAGTRARALLGLAREVADGRLVPGVVADLARAVCSLEALPGIGPWTAQLIAMRVFRWPDAFPAGDLILRRAVRAEAWRPWRAYAAQHLWYSHARGSA